MHAPLSQSYLLIGMPGVGKSSLGVALATAFSVPFFDTDQMMLDLNPSCSTIRELAKNLGEERFRELEFKVLLTIEIGKPHIISTGGGCVEHQQTLKLLAQFDCIVYLEASLNWIKQRLIARGSTYFIQRSEEELAAFYKRRMAKYQKLATFKVSVENGFDANLDHLIQLFEELENAQP